MAATWPSGVPYNILRNGAAYGEGETVARSNTDSGRARQRAIYTAALDTVSGSIRMTWAEYLTFKAWRRGLGGAVFDWPGMIGGTVEARFVGGQQGGPTPDSQTPKWLVPVTIELM